jgi:hypothetical protein
MPGSFSLDHGPLFRTDSDASPFYSGGNTEADRNSYLRRMETYRVDARDQAFDFARESPEINSVTSYIKALQNENMYSKNRPNFRSNFADNRLNNSRKNDLALLTDSRPTINVGTQVGAYKQNAMICQNIIQTEWTRKNIDLSLVGVVDLAKLNGTAFWKTMACSPGIMNVEPCGPDVVLPIQSGRDIQSATAIMYHVWQSLNTLRRKFPYSSVGLEREAEMSDQGSSGGSNFNRPGNIPETTWDRLSPQIRRAVGVQTPASSYTGPSMFQSIEKQEFWVDDPSVNESKYDVMVRNPYVSLKAHNYWYWVKPGQPLYPRKRLLVFGGRRLLYDGPSPFWHGKYPFACLRLDPIPWKFWGLSKYRDLLPLQMSINQIGAGVMDILTTILNPTAVTRQNAVAEAAWKAFYPGMPNAKLMMMGNANIATDLKYMDNPQLPQQVLLFHQYLSQEFDRISGAIDVHSLGKKKQVPGGDTIEQMREMMNTTTRLEGRYIEKFLEDAGQLVSSDVFQYYEMSVVQKLLGEAGVTWDQFNELGPNLVPENGLPKEDHWRNYSLKVSQGSLLSNAKDREKQLSIGLAQHGLLSVKRLHETLEIPPGDLEEILKERDAGIGASGKNSRTSRGQRNGKAA